METELKEIIDFIGSNKICISLEGSISAGKSTLCKSLNKYLTKYGVKYKHYPEPINQKFLDLFYTDMDKYSFSFQSFIIRERINIAEDSFNDLQNNDVNFAVIDRSPIGDCAFSFMLYKDKKITPQEFDVYTDIIKPRKNINKEGIKNIIIYLKCSTNKNRERIIKRGNKLEIDNCTESYLKQLDDSYLRILNNEGTSDEENKIINQVFESVGTRNVVFIDYEKDFEIKDDCLSEKDTFMVLKKIINKIK